VWYFVAVLHTKFACVLTVSAFSRGFGESQYDAILSQGMFYLRVGLAPVALGPAKHLPSILADQFPGRWYWPWDAE
jgi:hypothetical protein